ncbi:hypothetical protein [Spiroplasma alleghenense]|uniref:Transmembrane protein n=1 Tax=Spiroplasma alleghenense TaxID=216931 RepID=A0A345Z4E6_9MOLU|nr:hypothetical protein [Spiroplasma alleghenense]AXK51475.1 hypothetical protein SALLE_v1c08050 [Spiroplasma alleghenense]
MLKARLNFFKIFLFIFGILLVLSMGYFLINMVETSKVWDEWYKYMSIQSDDETIPGMSTIIYNQIPIKLIVISLLNPWLWIGSIAILSFFMFLSFVTLKQEARMLKKISITLLILIFISAILLSTSFFVSDWDPEIAFELKDWHSAFGKIKGFLTKIS